VFIVRSNGKAHYLSRVSLNLSDFLEGVADEVDGPWAVVILNTSKESSTVHGGNELRELNLLLVADDPFTLVRHVAGVVLRA